MPPRFIRPSTIIAAATFWVAAACGSGSALTAGEPSLHRLAERLLGAVVAGDTAQVHALRISEYEHNELLWPRFPASRPELNMPVDFAWANIQRRSRRDAGRIVSAYRDQALELVEVTCRADVEDYVDFRVHDDCWLTVRNRSSGARSDIKLFGPVVEWAGRFKIIAVLAD